MRYACYPEAIAGSIQKCNTPFDERRAHQIRQHCLKFIVVCADNTNRNSCLWLEEGNLAQNETLVGVRRTPR